MGAAAVVTAVGVGLQMYGNYTANKAEAKARRANAAEYAEQARYSIQAAKKQQAVFEMESEQFYGSQVNAFAKSGVAIDDSVLMQLARTELNISNESASIMEEGRQRARGAMFLSSQERSTANRVSSFGYNFLQASSVGVSGAGDVMSRSKSSGSSSAGSTRSYYSGPSNSMEILERMDRKNIGSTV